MAPLIVDSSVVAKWVLPENDSATAQKLLESYRGGDSPLILDLAQVEVANAIYVRMLRGMISPEEAQASFLMLRELPVQIAAMHDLLPRAFQICTTYQCAVYDALFVALVETQDADGVTADAPLVAKVATDFPKIKLLKDWQFS